MSGEAAEQNAAPDRGGITAIGGSTALHPPRQVSCVVRLQQVMSQTLLLLTVEDHFLIEGRGLVVVPPIDLPPSPLRFTPFSDELRIARPDGTEEQFLVNFVIEHFSLRGGGSKWKITPMIPKGAKETIPIGSRFFIREESVKRLKGIDSPPTIE